MPTRTFLPMAGSGYLTSIKSSYASAIAGPGNDINATDQFNVGQSTDGSNFGLYLTFLAFDTSSVPVGATITSAVMTTWIDNDQSAVDFTLGARNYAAGYGPWRPSITQADWVSNLAAHLDHSRGATLRTDTIGGTGAGTYYQWFGENLAAAINRGGVTELVLYSSRHYSGTAPAPGVNEYLSLMRTPPPQIVVTWTATGPAKLGVEWRPYTAPNVIGPWRSLDCQVVGASWTRGASAYRGVYTTPEAAQASIELLDPVRDLDPLNPWGNWYGEWDVGAELRLVYGGTIVFGGRITGIDNRSEPGGQRGPMGSLGDNRARITAADAFGKMAGIDLNESFPNYELTNDRFVVLLNRANVAMDPYYRLVEGNGRFLQPAVAKGDAWSLALDLAQHELGFIEWLADGRVRWSQYSTVWNSQPAVALGLGEWGGDTTGAYIPILSATASMARDYVRNLYRATRTGSTYTWEMHAPDSKHQYGLREERRDDLEFMDDNLMVTWLNDLVSRHARPPDEWKVTVRARDAADVERIESVPLMLGRSVHLSLLKTSDGTADNSWKVDALVRLAGVEWSVDASHAGICTLTLGQSREGQSVRDAARDDVREEVLDLVIQGPQIDAEPIGPTIWEQLAALRAAEGKPAEAEEAEE